MNNLYVEFGARVRRIRTGAGLTQEQLAERVGLSRTAITNIEKGKQHVALHQLLDIATALGVPTQSLLPISEEVAAQALIEKAAKFVSSTQDQLLIGLLGKNNVSRNG